MMQADEWFAWMGQSHVRQVDRLWPSEDVPEFRVACLIEEVGEVSRAVTKRRHAQNASDGLCKGKDVDEWSEELRVELCQVFGVLIDIAYREGIDLVSGAEETLAALVHRQAGS